LYAGVAVLSRYIEAALGQAQYEILLDEGGFYGSIPALAGVWAHSDSLEECREELKSALEDWLLFSLSRHQPIPTLEGIDLTVREVA
jgi:predicted RNase H-like HicB family nuclease